MSDFPFSMNTSLCLNLYFFIVLSATVTVQQFWNKDEFCQKLNSIQSLIGVTDARIYCKQFNDSWPITGETNMLYNVKLLCREFDSLTYTWNKNNMYTGNTIIVGELVSYNTMDVHLISKANLSYIRFDNLKPSTQYIARFWTLNNDTINYVDTRVVTTLSYNSSAENSIYSIQFSKFDWSNNSFAVNSTNSTQVSKFDLSKNNSAVNSIEFNQTTNIQIQTLLTWKSEDMNCQYRIVSSIISTDKKKIDKPVKSSILKIDVKDSYPVLLDKLNMNSTYRISIKPFYYKPIDFNVVNYQPIVFNLSTPFCLNEYNTCIPEIPYNVTSYLNSSIDNTYNITITWRNQNPNGSNIDYFVVWLDNIRQIVPSIIQEAYYENVLLTKSSKVSVRACSTFFKYCTEEAIIHTLHIENKKLKKKYIGVIDQYFCFMLTIVLVSTSCVVFVVVKLQLMTMNTNKAIPADPYGYNMTILKNLDDVDLMLDLDDVIVSDKLLGHGHFGMVRKGVLKMGKSEYPVAVKSLQNNPSSQDIEMFYGEILLMQKVGKHPNIVSMIGCCLDMNKRCMLVVEYCTLGDLQTYLRKVCIKSWYANDFYVDRVRINKKIEFLNTRNPPPMVFNNCYLYHSDENVFHTVDDLMRFASQTANGMMFLEKNHIVHRDLAARNVLLSDHHTVKICDFGLSRDVYEQNLYLKSKRGDPLPIKWMALESLKYQIYTSQSDVWSFGVFLWEIMMLGETPYPTISSSKIYEMLHKGYRMPRPTLCCYSLYEVMLACWHSNPTNRPKFATIKDTIDGIMENQYSKLS